MKNLTVGETALLNVLLRNARIVGRGFDVTDAHAEIAGDALRVAFQVADDPQNHPIFGTVPIDLELSVVGLDSERTWAPLLEIEPGTVTTSRRTYIVAGSIECGSAPIIEILFRDETPSPTN